MEEHEVVDSEAPAAALIEKTEDEGIMAGQMPLVGDPLELNDTTVECDLLWKVYISIVES